MFDSAEGVQALDNGSDDSAVGSTCSGKEEEPNMFTMNNYFGIGIGAELCLDFHLQREESPDKFNSRWASVFSRCAPLADSTEFFHLFGSSADAIHQPKKLTKR